MNNGQVISTRTIYHGKIINLRLDTVIAADGEESIREIIEHRDCITVVALDNEKRVLFVRQYREALGKTILEIPAGGVETGEDPAQATQRELREETGYQAGTIHKIGGFYLSPGYSTEYCHLFYATNLTPAPLYAEDSGEIELVRIPVNNISGLIASGEICDAKTIAGLSLVSPQYVDGGRI